MKLSAHILWVSAVCVTVLYVEATHHLVLHGTSLDGHTIDTIPLCIVLYGMDMGMQCTPYIVILLYNAFYPLRIGEAFTFRVHPYPYASQSVITFTKGIHHVYAHVCV